MIDPVGPQQGKLGETKPIISVAHLSLQIHKGNSPAKWGSTAGGVKAGVQGEGKAVSLGTSTAENRVGTSLLHRH